MKMICIGDSLTFGYGVARKDTWVSLAAGRTGVEMINAGICGDTTGGMLARFGRDVLEKRPDAVFIMGGGNDRMTGCPNCIAQSNLMGMAHQAISAGILPMVGLQPPVLRERIPEDWAAFASGNLGQQAETEYRLWLLRFGKTFGIPVVDFWRPFSEALGEEPPESLYLDGLHPTAKGHAMMAQTVCGALQRQGW